MKHISHRETMADVSSMADPSSPSNRKRSLYEFIHAIDRSLQVSVTRLSELPSRLKIDFGGLFLSNSIKVFWETRGVSEDVDMHLTNWITGLCDTLLNEVLCTNSDESTALRQILMMGLPPYADIIPTIPSTERFVTSLSAIQNFPETERDALVRFLEENPCVAPVSLTIWLRDCVVMLILQSSREDNIYNARTRQVLFEIAESFALDGDAIRMWERSIGEILHGQAVGESRAIVSQRTVTAQRIKIGLGAVGGAVILGVTGGLAFPVLATVASGVGAALTGVGLGVIGTVFATTSMVLGSISVAGAVALFGITGGSLMTYKLSNRFGNLDVRDFRFRRLTRSSPQDDHAQDALEVVLCVSGYLRSPRDCTDPWKIIRRRNGGLTDVYALQWEKKNLSNLGSVFVKLLSNELASVLTNIYIQTSLGAVTATATLPISVLSVMADSDNIFLVCENRARQAGEALAEVITNAELGTRPFTLIAYSVGATAVFSCLEVLASTGHYSRIQNVILLGSTIPCTFIYEGQRTPWQMARSVVSGRFINCYSKKDMLLHFLCRYVQWSIQVAGVTEVNEPGIENIDVSDIISTHSDYPAKIDSVLTRIGYIH